MEGVNDKLLTPGCRSVGLGLRHDQSQAVLTQCECFGLESSLASHNGLEMVGEESDHPENGVRLYGTQYPKFFFSFHAATNDVSGYPVSFRRPPVGTGRLSAYTCIKRVAHDCSNSFLLFRRSKDPMPEYSASLHSLEQLKNCTG